MKNCSELKATSTIIEFDFCANHLGRVIIDTIQRSKNILGFRSYGQEGITLEPLSEGSLPAISPETSVTVGSYITFYQTFNRVRHTPPNCDLV